MSACSPWTDYPADAVVTGIDTERARCVVVALTACASAGTVRKGVETAVNYIRTREQFGKPVGSFQALQHKAAVLLVNAELASASAWDAVRAIDESIEQHRLAAASAALMAVCAGPDLMLDALLMFGAIGYTWEHDTHLYWRRATSLAASLGSVTRWGREAGELARTLKRSTAINLGGRRVGVPGEPREDARPGGGAAERDPDRRRSGSWAGLRVAARPAGSRPAWSLRTWPRRGASTPPRCSR